ncbi:MAG: cytidylyltransferase domain-containing protein [Promethearchaeota archaeon]
MNINVIGIIPARGGSKGVPRKNIKLLGNKPLIKYTIDAANNSKLLTGIYVSSEDEEILTLAEKFGTKTIIRPRNLAEDTTPMIPVLQHAINHLEPKIGRIEILVLLQPTTPFKIGKDIDDAIKLLIETGADSVISLTKVETWHPAQMYKLEGNRMISFLGNEKTYKRRQELPELYLRNGLIYAYKRHTIMEQESQEGVDSRAIIIPYKRSVNIDELIDFEFAAFMLKKFEPNSS